MSGNLSPIDSGHSELQADQTVIKTEDTETMLPNEYCLPQLDLADPLATEKESSGTSSFYPLQESSTNFPTAASIAVKNVSKGLVSPAVPNASVKSIYLLEHSKNEEKPLVECEVSGDLVNKQSKFYSTLPDAKKIDVALRTMEEVYDKVNQLSERGDCFDDFGRYVASLLRSFPSGRAKELQQKVIGLILKSHPDQRISSLHDSDSPLIESVKINSAPIIKTTETVEVAQPSSQILGFQKHVSVTTKSTSQLTFPTQKLVAKKIPLTSDKASSKLVNKFDHVLEETEQINATFKRLEDISNKVNQLNKRDNYFENFGRYIISLLSSLPTQRAMKLQHKVINLILSSHINLIVA
ncbi:hypothetical protein C0J52_14036 [Blattella germanica]|nr:hypothetical protein C0J52_14036 [Blattella germanica]